MEKKTAERRPEAKEDIDQEVVIRDHIYLALGFWLCSCTTLNQLKIERESGPGRVDSKKGKRERIEEKKDSEGVLSGCQRIGGRKSAGVCVCGARDNHTEGPAG